MVMGIGFSRRRRPIQYWQTQMVGLVDCVRERMSLAYLWHCYRAVGLCVRRYLLWGGQLLSRKKVDE
jgi:hypothetical protein